jgi:hypothetical protein
MRGTVTTIEPTGQMTTNGYTDPIKLEALQAGVGGYIEEVPGFTKFHRKACVAFCNEEGKLKGLPVNSVATNLWRKQTQAGDFLVGNVVIVQGDDAFMESL